MPAPAFAVIVLGALGLLAQQAVATPPNDTVLAAAALVLPGQYTPLLLAEAGDGLFLSADGAQQMYGLGQLLRGRYLVAPNSTAAPDTAIAGLAQNVLDPSQLFVLGSDTQYDSASAQALLQGLYPPVGSNTSNGTSYPLGGYQYAWMHSATINDTERVWIDGAGICANYYDDNAFYSSTQYKDSSSSTADFYDAVANAIATPDIPAEIFFYGNAAYIYDYVSQLVATNATASQALNVAVPGALDRLRYLADGVQWNTYGAPSNGGFTRIAGQTAGFAMLDTLVSNIATQGDVAKLSALVGTPASMISLASLLDLPATQPNFYGAPLPGSALIIELFINEAIASEDVQNAYSDPSQLSVRLLFRNGTAASAQLSQYIMSNSGASVMSWPDFSSAISEFAMSDIAQWCGTCDSWLSAAFCMTYNSTAVTAATNPSEFTRGSSSAGGLTPAMAGAIGAVSTLAALILFLVLGAGCCGLRLVTQRHQTPTPGGISAAPAGFRGMRKLASDPDLGAATGKRPTTGVEVVKDAEGATLGHARVGSWELKETKSGEERRASMDEESRIEGLGFGRAVQPSERV